MKLLFKNIINVNFIITIVFVLFTLEISSCSNKEYSSSSIHIFENTPVWELAKAVDDEDTILINDLINSNLINFRDKKHHLTLLEWSILNDKFISFKQLLIHQADPNFIDTLSSNNGYIDERKNALLIACEKEKYDLSSLKLIDGKLESPYDTEIKASKFARLLLQKEAKYNLYCDTTDSLHLNGAINIAANHNLETLKLLINVGANPHIVCKNHGSPLLLAIESNRFDIINYLIYSCNVSIIKPIFYNKDYFTNKEIPLYAIEILSLKKYNEKSEYYKLKLQYLELFESMKKSNNLKK